MKVKQLLVPLICLIFYLYLAVSLIKASEFGLFGNPTSPSPAPQTQAGGGGGGGGGSGGGGGGGDSGGGGAPASSSRGVDLNGSGRVDIFDLSILLRNWNRGGTGDLNGSGRVDIFDLSILLRSWSR